MTEYKAVKISRILNPTSIDLGEYVINPYMGCEYACLYCYVRTNRVISKRPGTWGAYVDIRVNAPHLLEKEILLKRPRSVLLGSTTDCFQPAEKEYHITKAILEILNRYGVYYTILTRSTFIREYRSLLKKGFCRNIYFTINNMPPEIKALLEPKSPPYKERMRIINELAGDGISITPYFSPILPGISRLEGIFSKFPRADTIEFESLNFNAVNIESVLAAVSSLYPRLRKEYILLSRDRKYYTSFWDGIEDSIKKEASRFKKSYNIYIHSFGSYFKNRYART